MTLAEGRAEVTRRKWPRHVMYSASMGTDFSMGAWFFDASKYLVSFGVGGGLLFLKDWAERGLRRKHLRAALWNILRHEVGTQESAHYLIRMMRLALQGKEMESPLVYVDVTGEIEREVIALDHENASAYLRFAVSSAAAKRAHDRATSLFDEPRKDEARTRVHVAACWVLISKYGDVANARLAVLRTLQDSVDDHDLGSRVLAAAQADRRAMEWAVEESNQVLKEANRLLLSKGVRS